MAMMKKFFDKIEPVWFLALVLFPIVLWILPADFFDMGESVCPSRVFFDIECLGCGSTRAIMHLHHFDFEEAIYYNSGVFIFYPLLVLIWAYWLRSSYRKLQLRYANKKETSGDQI